MLFNVTVRTFGTQVCRSVRLKGHSKHYFGQPADQKHYHPQARAMAVPKLIVFDLDYTLWPFWVDTHVDPPFHMASNGKVYDAHKQHVKFYSDVPDILKRLHSEGFKLGIASRTGAVQEAADLTRLFNWDQYFHYRQIYPGCKITHFKKLHTLSGISFEDMLFFDDEHRNITDVSTLANGMRITELRRGFEDFEDTEIERLLKIKRRQQRLRKRKRKRRSLDG